MLNLPNQITLIRLILAILFFVLLCQFDVRAPRTVLLDVCLAIFVIAGATDWLDGYLARKTNQVTSLGRILDPFVDKVLVAGAFIIFIGRTFVNAGGVNVTGVAPWMVVVIIARELLVTGLRGFSESMGQAFGADIFGKVKTWAQMITAGVIMLRVAHGQTGGAWLDLTAAVLVWLTVVITSASGLNYLYKARKLLFH